MCRHFGIVGFFRTEANGSLSSTRELLAWPEAGRVSQPPPPLCCRPSVLGTAASFLLEEVPEDGKPVMDPVAAGPVSLGKWPLRLHVVIADAPFGLF